MVPAIVEQQNLNAEESKLHETAVLQYRHRRICVCTEIYVPAVVLIIGVVVVACNPVGHTEVVHISFLAQSSISCP